LDLSSANFHCLKFVNPELVLNCSSYAKLIEGMYREENNFASDAELPEEDKLYLKYLTNSKQLRQVIFGNLNPKRQQTIQKYLIRMAIQHIAEHCKVDVKRFVTASSDEAIIECSGKTENEVVQEAEFICKTLPSVLPQNFPPYKIQAFRLTCLESDKTGKTLGFVKEFIYRSDKPKNQDDSSSDKYNVEFKAVPAYIFAQAFKMYYNMPVTPNDCKFVYEGFLCSFDEPVV